MDLEIVHHSPFHWIWVYEKDLDVFCQLSRAKQQRDGGAQSLAVAESSLHQYQAE